MQALREASCSWRVGIGRDESTEAWVECGDSNSEVPDERGVAQGFYMVYLRLIPQHR